MAIDFYSIDKETMMDFDKDVREKANQKIKDAAEKGGHSWYEWLMYELQVLKYCEHEKEDEDDDGIEMEITFERLQDAKLYVAQYIVNDRKKCGCKWIWEIYPNFVMRAFAKQKEYKITKMTKAEMKREYEEEKAKVMAELKEAEKKLEEEYKAKESKTK